MNEHMDEGPWDAIIKWARWPMLIVVLALGVISLAAIIPLAAAIPIVIAYTLLVTQLSRIQRFLKKRGD
jgi:hypothetical protein